jgi:CBS domain-containing protein
MKISAILKGKGSDVVTASPDSTVQDVADLLAEKNIGAVLIADGGNRLKGILSERDIVRGVSRHGASLLTLPASDIMTKDVFSCSPDEEMNHLRREMTARRIRHIPIVQNDQLVGIVSIGDVVKNRVDELENEAQQMRDYIATG